MGTERHQVEVARLKEFVATDPVVAEVVRHAKDSRLYLVGGSVRDLLIGRRPTELDFVVEGPVEAIALALDPEATIHERFGTAEAKVLGTAVDLACARKERYPEPGALPEVESADLQSDLARRDFTVNAIACSIDDDHAIIDPFDGLGDLRLGVLRVLHPESFFDDPTRAFRAARYCARLDLSPDAPTNEGLRRVDLATISRERVDRELDLVAAEDDPASVLELLAAWGLVDVSPEGVGLARKAFLTLGDERWAGISSRGQVLQGLLSPETSEAVQGLMSEPVDPWEGFLAVRAAPGEAVLIARAAGADWLDRWPDEWGGLELRIDGGDLTRAGVPEGPAVGAGLEAALRDRVVNGDGGRERELSVALEESLGRE